MYPSNEDTCRSLGEQKGGALERGGGRIVRHCDGKICMQRERKWKLDEGGKGAAGVSSLCGAKRLLQVGPSEKTARGSMAFPSTVA